jgi:hypothetical protein
MYLTGHYRAAVWVLLQTLKLVVPSKNKRYNLSSALEHVLLSAEGAAQGYLMERQKIWAREPSLASILAALSELSPMAGGFLGFRCAPPRLGSSPLAPAVQRSVDFWMSNSYAEAIDQFICAYKCKSSSF